jgi:hypothetical protein
MPKLGQINIRYVTDEDERDALTGKPLPGVVPAEIHYRDGTAKEQMEFQGRLAELADGESRVYGTALSDLCREYGEKVIVKTCGWDVPDGDDQLAVLLEHGFHHIGQIGNLVFLQGGGQKMEAAKPDLGKPE